MCKHVHSESKQKTRFWKVSNTGIKSSLRAIEQYAYCLGYLYFNPRYGFPKSNGTVLTFYTQWRGWHRVISFNDQVNTAPHPILNFLGIYMSPVQWYHSVFWSTTAHSNGISAYYGRCLKFVSFKSWLWGWLWWWKWHLFWLISLSVSTSDFPSLQTGVTVWSLKSAL